MSLTYCAYYIEQVIIINKGAVKINRPVLGQETSVNIPHIFNVDSFISKVLNIKSTTFKISELSGTRPKIRLVCRSFRWRYADRSIYAEPFQRCLAFKLIKAEAP